LYTVSKVLTERIEVPKTIMKQLGSFIFVLLITIGAFVYIPLPFTPVPITLQVLFVLLAGIILGERYGSLSTMLYVIMGVLGLPVFAGATGGVMRLVGPTGGYIVGFIFAPIVVSFLYRKIGRNSFSTLVAMLGGVIVIYLFGALQLAIFLKRGFLYVMYAGILPFVVGDCIKIILAFFVVRFIKRNRVNE
jgi:biotin transport system substrate-specific component